MSKIQLTANATKIAQAVAAGAMTTKAIAEATDLTTAAVTGTMATLKKNDVVVITDGNYALGKVGKTMFTNTKATKGEKAVKAAKKADGEKSERKARAANPESKAFKSRELYTKLLAEGKKRGEIVNEFMSQFGLSKAAASTYVQNARRSAGLIGTKSVAEEPASEAEAAE